MAKQPPGNDPNDDSATPAAPTPRRPGASSRRRTSRETATADATAARPSASSDAVYDRPAAESASDAYGESMRPEGRVGPERPVADDPSEEDIRVRAYLRYLERGGGQGLEFEDWVEAERELKMKK